MNGNARGQRGFTLIELMVSVTVLLLAMAGLLSLLVHNARINKTQRINMELQSSARNSLAMVVQSGGGRVGYRVLRTLATAAFQPS